MNTFSHLFYTAARHRGAQTVRGLLVPLLLSDLVLVTLKSGQENNTLRVKRDPDRTQDKSQLPRQALKFVPN